MNKKLVICITLVTILALATLSGCNAKAVPQAKSVTPQTQVQPENNDKTSTTSTTDKTDGGKAVTETVPILPISQYKYIISSIPVSTKITFNTPWETSPLKKFSGTIVGRGENAQEEGYSYIIIKDEVSGKLTKLTLENEAKNQLTTKDIEWIDESEMFIIIGYPNGTVSKGGKIYKVNIKTGQMSLYTNTSSTKEEYTAVHKTATGYTFNKYIYDDANLTKGHAESGILHSK